ncbi:alpha/beta hydrolase [Sphingomonas crocodyli]|uniref:Alpha/beta hydrolase n=1 Tax=Sphingomonas crocodyli TaxID=1979270 RepID=A0A437LXY2_9SPHN|nr:alpha/beta hydrolase [Sphingomonas crocodyli]RVT90278.1 alpha/beta hydrolase [Sphingomonas crocodyli]
MTIDADVAATLEMLKLAPVPGPEIEMATFRAMMAAGNAARGEPFSITRVQDVRFPGMDGDVPARFYANGAPDAPLLLYFHGGGWSFCNLDTHDDFCRRLSALLGWSLLSVDYRLAPEHPYPAAFDDCWSALEWVNGDGTEALGITPTAIVVGGDSAGGNIAAGMCIAAIERDGPRIDHQLLLYPALDPRLQTESIRTNGRDYYLTEGSLRHLWGLYLGGRDADVYAAPAFHDDLSRLPPATIVTAEYDPLRDEARDYAARLEAAGVPVAYRCIEGTIHGFAQMPNLASQQKLMAFLKGELTELLIR